MIQPISPRNTPKNANSLLSDCFAIECTSFVVKEGWFERFKMVAVVH